jgi:hypothetical protein
MHYNRYKIQFMMIIKLLQVSASKCHPVRIYMNKRMRIKHVTRGADHQHLHWRVGFVICILAHSLRMALCYRNM